MSTNEGSAITLISASKWMPEIAPKDELLRALGRLVRGLSALFWGLPIALVVCVKTATEEWLRPRGIFPNEVAGILPALGATGLLFYGLAQLGAFQQQERVWRDALDRAKILALVNCGLSPFIFWWNKLPQVHFYAIAVSLLMLCGLLFLFNLNYALQRLAAMLPDETLRLEARVFGTMNLYLLCLTFALIAIYFILNQFERLPPFLDTLVLALEFARHWLLIFLILLPMAMTMSLIWKIKETIFASVFSQDH
jgi:hypothetical protein